MSKAKKTPEDPGLSQDERALVLAYYNEYLLLSPKTWESITPSTEGGFLTRNSVASSVKIRQWDREAKWQESHQWPAGGPPGPSPLQRVAGTIIEIGIDYFVHVPGALNEKTRQGKAIRAILTSLDNVEFADKPLGDLPTRLFVATLEAVSEDAKLLTSSEETQRLISIISSSLARDVAKRIQGLRTQSGSDADREDGIVRWAELVFRSVLSSGGRLVASDPKAYLGIDKTGDAALVTKVGESVIDFVTQLPQGELHQIFGKEGLNIVVSSALQAVGEHPEIIIRTDDRGQIASASADGLKKLLSEIATDIGKLPLLVSRPALLPEIVRLILDRTGKNLPVLWPQLAVDPRKSLLVVGIQKTLGVLSQAPPTGTKWTLRFTDEDLLDVTGAVLDAFVQNPGWLLNSAGQANENYRIALEATLSVLRKKGDSRLSVEMAVEILRAVLKAVALRQEFMEDLQNGEKLVGAAVNVVLTALFPDPSGLDLKAATVLLRSEVVARLVDESLQALARADLKGQALQQTHLENLRKLLNSHVNQILDGKSWSIKIFLNGLEKVFPPAFVAN